MRLKFIGGASSVTGSCYHLSTGGKKILVECGMRQGDDSAEANQREFPFDPKEVDLVIITHAHIDHSGMLPRLYREGFRGTVVMTPATRDVVEPLLFDSAEIQADDAVWLTRKALRAGKKPVEPLYTSEDVRGMLPLITVMPYGRVFDAVDGLKCRFLDAGHILGSASVEVSFTSEGKERKIVFSGDIGKTGNPIVRDPERPVEADYVVMESTYGSRDHRPIGESIDELAGVIKSTFKQGGNVYIPSFAVGRTQDLLYVLNRLARDGRLYRTDVYLDSPLAEEITRVYVAHPECYDEEAREFFTTGAVDSIRLHFTRTVRESMALNRRKSGAVVIAGSGMCQGGRIRHHLKHNLWRRECSVVFVGYQARGTLGRKIVDGARAVRILGDDVAVLSSIHTINGFSAHAGRSELIDWLGALETTPRIYLVHGEDESEESLAEGIRERHGFEVVCPKDGESVEL